MACFAIALRGRTDHEYKEALVSVRNHRVHLFMQIRLKTKSSFTAFLKGRN